MNNWQLKKGKPRKIQVEIIDKILKAIEDGYQNILLDAGTGIGKSAIATTIAYEFDKTYLIAGTTNQLSDQYKKDFNHILCEIKGRKNYKCNHGGTCEECVIDEYNARKIREHAMDKYSDSKLKLEKKCVDCPYESALKKALDSKIIITNYDYIYTGNYTGRLPERDLIIFDEAHNFEGKLLTNLEYSLNRKSIYKEYDIDIFDGIVNNTHTLKDIQSDNTYWVNLLNKLIEIDQSKLNEYLSENNLLDVDNESYMRLCQVDPTIKKYSQRIKRYDNLIDILTGEERWIICTDKKGDILKNTQYILKNSSGLTVKFKPLYSSKYNENFLKFGETRLFMSGTILSKKQYCNYVGINPLKTIYISAKSPFPKKNRPIIKKYIGNLNKNNWNNVKGLTLLKKILEEHENEKGTIHVSSKAQAEWLIDNLDINHTFYPCWNGKNKSGEYISREESLEEYINDSTPSILIGPQIKDGVDLPGDLCRFQIIFKIPYPNLGDAQTNKRVYATLDGSVWCDYQTITSLIQAYGRGIRNNEDYCKCYILDKNLEGLLNRSRNLFNEYFLEAMGGGVSKSQSRLSKQSKLRITATPVNSGW